ncbi:transposase [Bacillus sp. AFS088145]|uniref:transposase n=1 Tax=Bacillus sp. AFS088145 TaxID=2033514 RepID=UPI000BF66460|nr:transposase [Bacillus sp. AFS088145]PFH86409.1 transposase [Bacillus sp. AFS088145]
MSHHDKKFKLQAAKLVVEEGRSTREVARNLEINYSTLTRWVRKYKDSKEASFIGSGNLSPEHKEMSDFEKRIKELEEENAILKKAMHIFAKDPK